MADWGSREFRCFTQAALLCLLCLLAACGGGGQAPSTGGRAANYAPPGPPGDPWGPYIHEASQRFSVPERWIREVMRQESGGHEYLNGQPITSDAGAAGLMQVMPATYETLRERFSLGGDPYDPHDNIMAGTGYIADMYAQYGSPGFLAAYNAGPHRVDAYLAGRGDLPNETVNYLASIAPRLGNDRPMTGPLAAYADTGAPIEVAAAVAVPRAYVRAPTPGCWQDPDAAYDPDAPCRAPPVREPNGIVERGGFAVPPAAQVASVQPTRVNFPIRAPTQDCWHDPDAAYDAPCRPRPTTRPITPFVQRAVQRVAAGAWAVQVGAFADADLARRTAESVRSLAPAELGSAQALLGTTAPFGTRVLYRARLAGLSPSGAESACQRLETQHQACVVIAPGH